MNLQEALRATPDTIVVLFPTPWQRDETMLLTQTYAEFWQNEAVFELQPAADEEIRYVGRAVLEDETEARLAVEPALPQLLALAPSSLEPFVESELMQLEKHASVWRMSVAVAEASSMHKAALAAARLMSTFVEAGAPGAFLPATHRLHSPQTVKHHTVHLNEQSLTNLFVGAWHSENWMRTRGLTSLGLPEIETPVDEGLNAAYFRLMDTAASMIAQAAPFAQGSRLQAGPKLYTIEEGPRGPADEEVPISGTFGVLTLLP